MWDRYLDLETRVGNAASLHKVDRARRKALNEVYEDRQALFLVDRFKFMNLWPCDSEQLKLMGYGVSFGIELAFITWNFRKSVG